MLQTLKNIFISMFFEKIFEQNLILWQIYTLLAFLFNFWITVYHKKKNCGGSATCLNFSVFGAF